MTARSYSATHNAQQRRPERSSGRRPVEAGTRPCSPHGTGARLHVVEAIGKPPPKQKTPLVGDDGRGLFGEPLGAGRMLARTSVSAYGSTVRPFVLSVTVTSVNATTIGGLQSGLNVAVSVSV
jgi:hypothetical protein